MPVDEPAAETVDGERPGDLFRLAGRAVQLDLVVVDVGEPHQSSRTPRSACGR